MADFIFDTITPAQAAGFLPSDSLAFTTGSADLMRATFLAADQVALAMGERTVTFGAGIAGKAGALPGDGQFFVGTAGPDAMSGPAGGATGNAFFGGAGDDVLTGGPAGDVLQGNQGADTMNGGGGNDCILGGGGNDSITGGAGTDVCIGGPGTDTFATCETQIQ